MVASHAAPRGAFPDPPLQGGWARRQSAGSWVLGLHCHLSWWVGGHHFSIFLNGSHRGLRRRSGGKW